MAHRWKLRGEEALPSSELNIVPFLDVVVNLMLFLLATSTATLAVTQIDAHAAGRRVGTGRSLDLTVTLEERGIGVAARGGVLAPGCDAIGGSGLTIPRANGRYDFAALGRCLERIHARFPDEDSVVVTAAPTVEYEALVHAMDASSPAFPRVLLAPRLVQSSIVQSR